MKNYYNIYKQLHFIRTFELKVAEVYPSDNIKSPIHLSLGQEFVSVAVCQHLSKDDFVAATYRGHAAYLAKGGCPNELIAEMYGKSTGCSKGRGGSMHLISPSANVIGTSAIVGSGIPTATGYALAQKMKATGNVVVCFMGDGATEEGCFYESMNFAGLKKLPILYVVENNQFAIHEPISKRWADPVLENRAKGFGVSYERHSTGDILTLLEKAETLIEKVRGNEKPVILEVDCYRWYQHVGPDQDFEQGYRNKEDANYWLDNDPLFKLRSYLSQEEIDEVEIESNSRVQKAFEFAERSEFPDEKDLKNYVYK